LTRKTIIIEVPKPAPVDNGPIDTVFGRHWAISNAASNFWDMKLAGTAQLGTVTELENGGYSVEFIYYTWDGKLDE
jgi:hypothetical protein